MLFIQAVHKKCITCDIHILAAGSTHHANSFAFAGAGSLLKDISIHMRKLAALWGKGVARGDGIEMAFTAGGLVVGGGSVHVEHIGGTVGSLIRRILPFVREFHASWSELVREKGQAGGLKEQVPAGVGHR